MNEPYPLAEDYTKVKIADWSTEALRSHLKKLGVEMSFYWSFGKTGNIIRDMDMIKSELKKREKNEDKTQ